MTTASGHLDPHPRTASRPDERGGLFMVVGLIALFGVLVLLFT